MSVPKFHVDEVAIIGPMVGGNPLRPEVYGQECTITELPRDRRYKRLVHGSLVIYEIPNSYAVELGNGERMALQEGYLRKRYQPGTWKDCGLCVSPAKKLQNSVDTVYSSCNHSAHNPSALGGMK